RIELAVLLEGPAERTARQRFGLGQPALLEEIFCEGALDEDALLRRRRPLTRLGCVHEPASFSDLRLGLSPPALAVAHPYLRHGNAPPLVWILRPLEWIRPV